MHKIVLELSPASCKKALDELKQYRKRYKKQLDEVCRRLAEIGAEEARKHFALAAANTEEGNGGVDVLVEKIENGYKIVARGEDVYFIEFGTGNSAGMFYGDGLPPTSVPVYPGSYSEKHDGIYAKYGYWFYQGNLMSSTDVYMPMYHAGKAIRDNEKRVAEEVFGK